MDLETVAPYALVWLVCALIAGFVGSGKGNGGAGFLLGLLLGPLGVIVAAVMRPTPEREAAHLRAVHAHLGASPQPGWFPDPYGRHQQRYFDGIQWTTHVVDDGEQTIDAPPPSM